MHRIDTKTAQKDKFGAGKNGFTRGNPQTGTPATDLDDDYFDMLQEELCSVVEASGASLEKGRHDQLLTALRALLLSRKNPFGDIKSDGTVETALENLGLGDANGYVGRKVAEKWITTSGTYTPTPGTKKIRVTIIGGGGGGGSGQTNSAGYVSAGSGGGAGGVARKTIDVTSVSSVSVTIGSGGNPGVFSSNQPGDGGTTSFGSYMTAGGGGRGNNCGSVAFGVTQLIANGGGGVGSGGDINTIGGSGGPAIILGQGYTSGGGGNSIVAGGGQPIATTSSMSGIDGSYGSGGSGAYILASGSEKNGGRGGDGVCIVEEYA
ncbi:carbohydrate kinase [Escherichia coli]|nr:carbohydrate kinase [Escherichia coli]MCX9240645.1 carbohydrate kinase [Escherichia coli]MCX9258822.1 carbohydrate kinase [Escherichia coli]MCX9294451.1 carbohydrate kinase [Escherichia coli]MCX9307304.1 carbohydrate kinase [Escherichia coli]